MKIQEIREIIKLVDGSSINEFTYEAEGTKIKLKKNVGVSAETGSSDANTHQILSPMVGTFYQSPSPEEPAYVQVGTKVTADQVVCIVEAMKLFNEIEAEVDGEIAEILVKDGQLVEYGQPLFLVKTN
ncbi:acetyl-CoA carboxylase biotin carboxyl carrier protein [Planococcus halotolerans]|uniref:acetyl-CoA carboxylase biotin carboxyl carrier protein n=1 Tax=Planococcus halotolerans TaxID=2233542 RepID=UPI0013677032|nr:acetyl-CoA carboxylase biotin carboxyl carrier protein [Planococcus halotolerans]QHJ71455.1 acetyl-CoA carboxylase biotin carboxyl carrier protein [Planococcus halotolerans]